MKQFFINWFKATSLLIVIIGIIMSVAHIVAYLPTPVVIVIGFLALTFIVSLPMTFAPDHPIK